MDDHTLTKVGGGCSILLGISYIVVGLTFLLDPTRTAASRHEILVLLAQKPPAWILNHVTFVVGAILALGAIPAISQEVRRGNEGWVRWAMNIAYLGITITALTHIQFLTLTLPNAERYVQSDAATQAAFLAAPTLGFDVEGWFRYGCLGLWMLLICLAARRNATLPLWLVYLGIVGAVLYLMLPVSSILPFDAKDLVETIAAVLGGIIVGPIWFIGIGWHLYRPHTAGIALRDSQAVRQ